MLTCAIVLIGCQPRPTGPQASNATASIPPVELARAASLENGRWLYLAGGCGSCHSSADSDPGGAPILGGGLALETAFGTFQVPNISADRATGIGGWSVAEFDRALRQGIAPDGHAYFPAFPYPSYARMSAADVADLHAYLSAQPKVARTSPGHDLALPLRSPGAASLWRALYFRPGPVVDLGAVTAEVARGQYLVEGPGHCGECHTPRGVLGGPRYARWLGGGEMADGTGRAPNLSPHPSGLGGKSTAEIVAALTPTGPADAQDFGMTAVRANLAQLPESDLAAIAAYLLAIPPVASRPGG